MSVARPSHRRTARGSDYGKYRYNSNRANGIHGSRAVGELEIIKALQGTGDPYNHIISSSFAILCNHVRPLFADKEKTMARQTTKRKVETPEGNAAVLEEIKRETGIDALRAEIDRLNWVIRQKDLTINALQKGNEKLSDELSKARNDC